jgi:hypothetical protein
VWGSEGIAPPFLGLALGGLSGQLHAPAALPLRNCSRYLLKKARDGGAQAVSMLRRRENSLVPAGSPTPIPRPPSPKPVAIPTELFRILNIKAGGETTVVYRVELALMKI